MVSCLQNYNLRCLTATICKILERECRIIFWAFALSKLLSTCGITHNLHILIPALFTPPTISTGAILYSHSPSADFTISSSFSIFHVIWPHCLHHCSL
ncbi:hypothetical protein CEXT_434661 [Caerostris extrusa]|uniref:Uncharacterized protein n=1 Tax=Caerostris extrusa TaxID=172846 RepID=A0AAV4NZE6_CAEEX|nr:hypothetical protein CEXT_434661 [Caerostris extrusa]